MLSHTVDSFHFFFLALSFTLVNFIKCTREPLKMQFHKSSQQNRTSTEQVNKLLGMYFDYLFIILF